MIFLGPKIIKGSPEKLLSYYFIQVFQFFTLAQVGTGQIYYFREFINLPSINLKSFYCMFKVRFQSSDKNRVVSVEKGVNPKLALYNFKGLAILIYRL